MPVLNSAIKSILSISIQVTAAMTMLHSSFSPGVMERGLGAGLILVIGIYKATFCVDPCQGAGKRKQDQVLQSRFFLKDFSPDLTHSCIGLGTLC